MTSLPREGGSAAGDHEEAAEGDERRHDGRLKSNILNERRRHVPRCPPPGIEMKHPGAVKIQCNAGVNVRYESYDAVTCTSNLQPSPELFLQGMVVRFSNYLPAFKQSL